MSALIAQSGMIIHAVAGYDPDAQALFDMLATPLPETQKEIVNAAFVYIKGGNPHGRNTYALLDMLAMFQHMPTEESALICWKRKIHMAKLGAPVFSRALGFDGDSAGSINSLWIPMQTGDNYTANDASFGVRISKPSTGVAPIWGGTNRGNRIIVRASSATVRVSGHINTSSSTTYQPAGAISADAGDVLHVARESGSVQRVYKNGGLVASGGSSISAAAFTEPVYLLSHNGSPDILGDGGAAFYWGGAAVTAVDIEILNGANAILSAMPA